MAVTCLACNRKFKTIAEVGDHIAETNEGRQGVWMGYGKEEPTSEDFEREKDVFRGFSHVNYINERGEKPSDTELFTLLMAGAKWCIQCNQHFTNNYRLYEHVINEGHAKDTFQWEMAIKSKRELDEFEKKWF